MYAYYNDQIKVDEMGRACSTHGRAGKAYDVLVGNSEAMRPLRRPSRT
jgi:hypothetical protein